MTGKGQQRQCGSTQVSAVRHPPPLGAIGLRAPWPPLPRLPAFLLRAHEVRYLKVKNWSEFQHYKDRNPPWIKLHRTLLDDYEFSCLQDASKAHLMLIWLFASQNDGAVPEDAAFLKRKLGLEKEPNLKWFVNHGLLIPEQDASNAQSERKQNAPLEESEAYKASEADVASSAKAPSAGEPVNGNAVAYIPVNDGTEFGVTPELAAELGRLYPAVDVQQTLNEIRGWNIANPSRKKTRRGVISHINSWMAKEQNRGPQGR